MPKFLPYLALALLSFLTLEGILRWMCVQDADGNATFRSYRLKPYRLPVHYLQKSIDTYTTSDQTGPVYDPDLGWGLRPNAHGHNSAGFVTTGNVPNIVRNPDTLRIALLGDSYTQGNFQWGWWRVLEQKLNAAGVHAEILNFGVSGFGTDQAFLRWRKDCKPWQPQMVLYGFMADACTRNLNLFRVLRDNSTGIPFMKPRFVLENGQLRLVNSPTPPPEALKSISRDITQWDCLKYEHFYHPSDYRMLPWRWSRLGAILEARLIEDPNDPSSEHFFDLRQEGGAVALGILRRMQEEITGADSEFLVVSLPCETDLQRLRNREPLPQADLLKAMHDNFKVIDTEQPLIEIAKGKDVGEFFADSHYTAPFDSSVAETIANYIRAGRKLPAQQSQ